MDYYTRFISRVTRDGLDNKERIQTFVRREYDNFIQQSPTRETVLINGKKVICSIQTERFRDEKNLKYLVTRYDNSFPLGSLVYRDNKEIWMLLRHEPHPFEGDNRYIMIECKHTISWVDTFGVIIESPCVIFGDMDSRIKENFRTWNNMITPQPNKYLEIIMPIHAIRRTTKVLIDNEAWYLVDFDKITIAGVIYMSFTESAVNIFDDDLENDLADSDKVGMVEIRTASTTLTVAPNVVTSLNVNVFKRGNILVNAPLLFEYDEQYIDIVNGSIAVSQLGEYDVIVKLAAQPQISITIHVICSNAVTTTPFSIQGNSSVRWGRQAIYTISRFSNGEEEISDAPLNLEPTYLATLESRDSEYILTANENNDTGTVILTATIAPDMVLRKEVQITALWS